MSSFVGERNPGASTLLSFSAGADSVAAATLLPDDTKLFFCQRDYPSYRLAEKLITLPSPIATEQGAQKVGALMVPNTFETIGLAFGLRHGFQHGFGYAAIGLLLADFYDAGVIAFGSVMEQVFMGSGNNYLDIVALKTARVHRLMELFGRAGLLFSLPTGGLSEVLTNRISASGPYRDIVISCPKASADGIPCGRCFKCFRKTRLDGTGTLEPEPSVEKVFYKRPLKSATSLIYAAQKSGYQHAALAEYMDEDLSFLDRFHMNAVDGLVPEHLRGHLLAKLEQYGVARMSEDDEVKLRSVGKTFSPDQFDPIKAGLVAG